MTLGFELDPSDYHLRPMIEQTQRDGRSEAAIESAVRIASGWKPAARMLATPILAATGLHLTDADIARIEEAEGRRAA